MNTMNTKRQRGFTLVELAIVLVIVGLLISGILKGQELIANAQVNASVSKAKAIEAAVITFRDNYYYLPGDITNPGTKLQNCTAECATSGDQNNRIGTLATFTGTKAIGSYSEDMAAFPHLAAANLLGEVAVDVSALEFGNSAPSAPIGGGFLIGVSSGQTLAGHTATTLPQAGHYLGLVNSASAAIDDTSTVMTPAQSERFDRKMDDGAPNTGSVNAIGVVAAGATQCATAATNAGLYAVSVAGVNCGLYIRILN
ncbi:MAG: prepilin-type N-terminal cleavage/methylation domain-containing protein [Pseudomonadota bacterium]